VLLAVWGGQEAKATELLEAAQHEASARGMGRFVSSLTYLESVLSNSLRSIRGAREAAWRVFERDELGFGSLIVPELAEAASRTGDEALLKTTLDWLTERAHVTPTEWARRRRSPRSRAIERRRSRRRALPGSARAPRPYPPAYRARPDAPALRGVVATRAPARRRPRAAARSVRDAVATMGVDGFSDRAQRELLATGETVRRLRFASSRGTVGVGRLLQRRSERVTPDPQKGADQS
jgi:hypothetical protein